MQKMIKDLSTDFVMDWDRRNTRMDYSLRFPLLHDFLNYIQETVPPQKREKLFEQEDIYSDLQFALIMEIKAIIPSL